MNKVAVGFFVAPLVPTAIGTLLALIFPITPHGPGDVMAFAGFLAFVGYAAEAFVGAPLYLIFLRRGWVRFWHFVALGALSLLLPSMLISTLVAPPHHITMAAYLLNTLASVLPFGAVSGAALWWFAVRRIGA